MTEGRSRIPRKEPRIPPRTGRYRPWIGSRRAPPWLQHRSQQTGHGADGVARRLARAGSADELLDASRSKPPGLAATLESSTRLVLAQPACVAERLQSTIPEISLE